MRQGPEDTTVVVVAPAAWRVAIDPPRGTRGRVVRFETLDDLDRWRSAGGHARNATIRAEVLEALRLAGATPASLSPRLRFLIEKIGHRHTVPRVKELQRYTSSPRAFFRLWAGEIAERPSQVLLRARVLFAAHLIEQRQPATSACRKAGFRSVPDFARHAHLGGAACVRIASLCRRRGRARVAED
jgi:hypothetical protein